MSGKDERVWLITVIEVVAREFQAKLLLACMAAEAGYGAILGRPQGASWMKYLPRGIFLDKAINNKRPERFRAYRRLGNEITAWDEEGLMFYSPDVYHERVSVEALEQVRYFFCWGEMQADAVLAKAPDAAEKVVVTGNPRFDLLRPEFRGLFAVKAEQLRQTHGLYLLVNTNFGTANHFYKTPAEMLDSLKRVGEVNTEASESSYRDQGEYESTMFRHFLAMLPILSRAFPEHRIIVRPHPAENQQTWREATAGLPNVRIIHEGPVAPWMMAAKAVIHNNCTTGVEAFLLERPVFAYCPISSKQFDYILPNALSHQASDAEGLCEALHAHLSGRGNGQLAPDRPEIARKYIQSIDGPLATEQILAALQQIDVQPQPFERSAWQKVDRLVTEAWPTTRQFLARTVKGGVGAAYTRQKFPSLTLAEVEAAVAELHQVSGRFAELQVRQVDKHLFQIYQN
ncbi:MAG: hypothetical protein L0331_16600 [Chloroflexi bacterium]|nr:hypothetical protein [Chloroflexota bacterium]